MVSADTLSLWVSGKLELCFYLVVRSILGNIQVKMTTSGPRESWVTWLSTWLSGILQITKSLLHLLKVDFDAESRKDVVLVTFLLLWQITMTKALYKRKHLGVNGSRELESRTIICSEHGSRRTGMVLEQ